MEPFAQYVMAAAIVAIPAILAWIAYELTASRRLLQDYFCSDCHHTAVTKLPHGYVVFIWDGNVWKVEVDACKEGCSPPPAPKSDGEYVGQCHVAECVVDAVHSG